MLHENRKRHLAEVGGRVKRMENEQYRAILRRTMTSFPHWAALEGKVLLLSGAAGMIGCFLVDLIMYRNESMPQGSRCRIIAVGRNITTARERLSHWFDSSEFYFIEHDVVKTWEELPCQPDYLIHGASTSHPLEYSMDPINTIMANVLGTHNMLKLAAEKEGSRFLLLSSVEIYGENRDNTAFFREDYCGYLNCNTLRSGYPEAKRVSESLCQAYIAQEKVDAAMIRLPRCYGPTMKLEDSKAVAQFIKNGVNGENIVLKSEGTQLYSFAHVSDAALGILWVLLRGECGQAYNLGDERSDIMQKDLAKLIADYAGSEVITALPDEIEQRGYSTVQKALLDGEKLKKLGWRAKYDIVSGIQETIDILRRTGTY